MCDLGHVLWESHLGDLLWAVGFLWGILVSCKLRTLRDPKRPASSFTLRQELVHLDSQEQKPDYLVCSLKSLLELTQVFGWLRTLMATGDHLVCSYYVSSDAYEENMYS